MWTMGVFHKGASNSAKQHKIIHSLKCKRMTFAWRTALIRGTCGKLRWSVTFVEKLWSLDKTDRIHRDLLSFHQLSWSQPAFLYTLTHNPLQREQSPDFGFYRLNKGDIACRLKGHYTNFTHDDQFSCDEEERLCNLFCGSKGSSVTLVCLT